MGIPPEPPDEQPPPPPVGAEGGECPRCGTPYEPFQEYCLEQGISEVTAVVEMWWLPRWHQAGFKVRPLGLPQMIEGQPCIAAAIQICEESLHYVRRLAGLRSSSPLLREDSSSSDLDRVPHVAA